VCVALVSGGADAALAALAAQSIRLYRHVASGALSGPVAFKNLLQVACNIRLPQAFGRRAVRVALNAGPDFYNALWDAS